MWSRKYIVCCICFLWRMQRNNLYKTTVRDMHPKHLSVTSRLELRLSFRISKCLASNTNSNASFLSDRGSAGLRVCTSRRPICKRKVSRHDHNILCHWWRGAPPRPVLPCGIITIDISLPWCNNSGKYILKVKDFIPGWFWYRPSWVWEWPSESSFYLQVEE